MSWKGCSDDQLAGLRNWASQRTIGEIHEQIEGYLGKYPTLCPGSNDLGDYEAYARQYAKGTQKTQTRDSDTGKDEEKSKGMPILWLLGAAAVAYLLFGGKK